jgi:pimeloyl-ACP methyl ester carboxylesterase
MATQKFTINTTTEQIDDLHARLKGAIMPSEIEGSGWSYGPSQKFVKDMIEHALTFDIRGFEDEVNQYPQFTTTIDGQKIHFLHVRSERKDAQSLMLIHGWPGSFVEYLDMIEPLTNPKGNEQAFHVVIPSIPGFGFSGPTHESGWNNGRIAKAFVRVMEELGYETFGVHGADAGATIAPTMARLAPKQVTGVHVNAATMGFIPFGEIDAKELETFTKAEQARAQRLQQFMAERFGFNAIQSTRPQALAYAISDSPAGLIAWISELFTEYGDKTDMVSKDRFVANFMVYWLSGTAASSIRYYYEGAHDPEAWAPKENPGVPTGVAVFEESDVAIRRYSEAENTIVHWAEYEKGGHYASLEYPEVVAKDIQMFFAGL